MAGLIVVGGPTASGKSALALALAEALGGVVVNADSMQLYRELRILTARPSVADEARVPHRLFGVLPAAPPSSAGHWLQLAAASLDEARTVGRPAIVVGGTGLYLEALLRGIVRVPEIPPGLRHELRRRHRATDGRSLHAQLAGRDPEMAARLHPSDRQRLLRALEVHAATGRSLASWQAEAPVRLALAAPVTGVVLAPPRAALHGRIERRLGAMVEAGALGEVRAVLGLSLDPGLPIMKALALRELAAHLAGRSSLEEALARAALATRHYAKRQQTWFRHHLLELRRIEGFGDEHAAPGAATRLGRLLLTGRTLPHTVPSPLKPGPDRTNHGSTNQGADGPKNGRGIDR